MEEAHANELAEVKIGHREQLKKKDDQIRSLSELASTSRDKKASNDVSSIPFLRPIRPLSNLSVLSSLVELAVAA